MQSHDVTYYTLLPSKKRLKTSERKGSRIFLPLVRPYLSITFIKIEKKITNLPHEDWGEL